MAAGQPSTALKSAAPCADDTKGSVLHLHTSRPLENLPCLVPGSPSNDHQGTRTKDGRRRRGGGGGVLPAHGRGVLSKGPRPHPRSRRAADGRLFAEPLEAAPRDGAPRDDVGPAGQRREVAKICHRRAALLARLSTKVVRRSSERRAGPKERGPQVHDAGARHSREEGPRRTERMSGAFKICGAQGPPLRRDLESAGGGAVCIGRVPESQGGLRDGL